MTNQGKSNDPFHRELQLVHERYFRDVNDVWANFQSRCRSAQTEFERGVEKVYQSQPPDFRAMQAEYQQNVQSLFNDPTLPQQYAEAYEKYKAALKQLIAGSDINDLGFTEMRNLGQSLLCVSTQAMNLVAPASPDAPAASDPFTPPGGAPGAVA